MSIKLGNTTASLYLGSTPVAAYLGSEQVYSAAATLYFNGAVNGNWTTVGNWWLDAGHTQAAGRLPTSDESVVVAGVNITGSGQAVFNFTLDDPDGNQPSYDGNLTVAGIAAFNGESFNYGTVTGNAIFNDSSVNVGTVTGNAIFNDSSRHSLAVTGTATFTGSACNQGGTAGTFVPDPPPSCPE